MANADPVFDVAEAAKVYGNAGTLRASFTTVAGIKLPTGIDQDATIKASSVDTNLDAMVAGYKGTSMEEQMTKFAETIREYPELKDSLGDVMKDEGAGIAGSIAELATGDGAIDMDQFGEAMKDPAKRDIFRQMLDRVATADLGPDYAVKFSRSALKAMKNPNDPAAVDEFTKIAQEGGVDLGGVKQEAAMDMLKDFFKDPQKFITQFVDSLQGLDPQYKEMITGMMNGVVGFYKDIISDYAYGHDGAPGLIEIAQDVGENARVAGAQARATYLDATAPGPTGMG